MRVWGAGEEWREARGRCRGREGAREGAALSLRRERGSERRGRGDEGEDEGALWRRVCASFRRVMVSARVRSMEGFSSRRRGRSSWRILLRLKAVSVLVESVRKGCCASFRNASISVRGMLSMGRTMKPFWGCIAQRPLSPEPRTRLSNRVSTLSSR